MNIENFLPLVFAVLLAPLLEGMIRKTKAFFAGRKGFPIFQVYRDIYKLLHKGAVYSNTVTGIFQLAPTVNLAVVLLAAAWLPFGGFPGMFSFNGDFLALIYLLGISRFFTILAAMDTGSSFEGMGANREAYFSVFVEPALLLGFAALAGFPGENSFWNIIRNTALSLNVGNVTLIILVFVSFFILALAENCRVPVDDPTTHLELTMIHEVMVLDNSGPDLAMIEYGSSLKLWFFLAMMMNLILSGLNLPPVFQSLISFGGMLVLTVIIGVIESVIARVRMIRVPQLLSTALAFSLVAILLKGLI